MSTAPTGGKYEAVVVGGGPGGLTVVGNLLERQITPILWVDAHFRGGRIPKAYREVPSNTKVNLFVAFAEAVSPFKKICDKTPAPNAITSLRQLDQDKGCKLTHAADMCLMLTEGLRRTPGVEMHTGKAVSATLDQVGSTQSSCWNVAIDSRPKVARASRLFLCTGASPVSAPLPASPVQIGLDLALSPTRLAASLPQGASTIAVIGASHSAILVLRNLYNLATTTHSGLHVKWFTRHKLRYAEYMDGWILRDNTGLKLEAAEWARTHLEDESFTVGPYIEKHMCDAGREKAVYEAELPACDFVVQAIGFAADPIPSLTASNGKAIKPVYDYTTSGFTYDDGKTPIPGLYGAGIAWPERVTDLYGNVEYAVGFWKFMKYLKRVSASW
ncbi:hypothetical protein FISHEDRAFT_63806 [Fistulina hepatica ATCC 64428]|uniref:FAD/NAD(P)-binding domain-containing protein n=1 Tax=Fistulina hepatica ATCC 64428 TaxID=1128425 RepID=A0A0D7AMB0_9AGAR|nr:hypothetical protein FISHEDRAFT_63806 [Fistulina hepatica ATCC 64428]